MRWARRLSRGLGAGASALIILAIVPGAAVTNAKATATATCTAAGGVKPLIRGLVDRAQIPPAPNLQGAAIEVKWSDLEPSGPGLVAGNPIDVALAAAGCSLPLRLRVLAGTNTPEWVKQDSGGDISLINPFDGSTGTVGHFWTASFQADYDRLQSELAAAYDSVPNLDEIVVSRCSLFYPEPFLRDTSIKSNVTNLLAAGYTLAADQQCQLEEIDSSVSRWATTRVGVSFNPYQVLNSDGTTGLDENFTEQVMGYCRYTAGPRCVLENDSIRDPISGLIAAYGQMYSVMSGAAGPVHVTIGGLNVDVALGAPLAFQTAVAGRIGDFWGTLIWARQHHSASVELPVDGTYPTSGGTGAPAWQTLSETAQWFQDDPELTPAPVALVEGGSSGGVSLASLNLDELAALDTVAGYGDVGAVAFDSVTALVRWPDAVTEAALLQVGSGPPAGTVICTHVRWCGVTISGGGHALTEEVPAASALVNAYLAAADVAYIPADGISPATAPAVSVSDAGLSFVKLRLEMTKTPLTARLKTTFADGDPGGLSSDYTVTITWGDGSQSVLAAVKVSGGFAISTTHAYAGTGLHKVLIAVSDAGGATLTATRWVTVS